MNIEITMKKIMWSHFCGDSVVWDDLTCKTMIYTDKDNKYLKEKHEETFKKLESDPEATEEEKDRIWRAIQEISRGY